MRTRVHVCVCVCGCVRGGVYVCVRACVDLPLPHPALLRGLQVAAPWPSRAGSHCIEWLPEDLGGSAAGEDLGNQEELRLKMRPFTQVDSLPRSPQPFQEAPQMFEPENNTLVFLKCKNQRTPESVHWKQQRSSDRQLDMAWATWHTALLSSRGQPYLLWVMGLHEVCGPVWVGPPTAAVLAGPQGAEEHEAWWQVRGRGAPHLVGIHGAPSGCRARSALEWGSEGLVQGAWQGRGEHAHLL